MENLYIAQENVIVGLQGNDKASIISQIIGHVANTSFIDSSLTCKLLLERERKRSSGCGKQVALLHLIDHSIPERIIALATLKSPVKWDSVDGKDVRAVGIVLAPPNFMKYYFDTIRQTAKILGDDTTLCSVLNMETAAQVAKVFHSFKDHNGKLV